MNHMPQHWPINMDLLDMNLLQLPNLPEQKQSTIELTHLPHKNQSTFEFKYQSLIKREWNNKSIIKKHIYNFSYMFVYAYYYSEL